MSLARKQLVSDRANKSQIEYRYIGYVWIHLGIFENKRICCPKDFTPTIFFNTDISMRSATNYNSAVIVGFNLFLVWI